MAAPFETIEESLRQEFAFLWAAHARHGLDGSMRLYTLADQEVWRSERVVELWFGPEDTESAIDFIREHYHDGELPNSPPLLDPLVHRQEADGSWRPLGSGVYWASAFVLGIATMGDDQFHRIDEIDVLVSHFHRGENRRAGLKMLGVADTLLAPGADGRTVDGCRALYDLSNVEAPDYWSYYCLSGLNYLCAHGLFVHPGFDRLARPEEQGADAPTLAATRSRPVQKVLDCALCFLSYDRQHRLYVHFGQDVRNIAHNNRFYDLCARDLHLFDRTGPQRISKDEHFEFVVPGLIPRGAVTLLAASGGTGKSSVAHQLCVQASIDWRPDERRPLWLGQPVNVDICTGICVYFSGEDGPAITNARGALFDPEGRAYRLQFHRTEFEDRDETFAQYLRSLRKMPDVSVCVIDPARKFLAGNEDDSQAVSEFFEAIEEFAIQKQCAMIVVHHLQKGAYPRSAREVLDELRGSQVFIDRPRVVLGMYRDEKHTVVGLSKTNIPPSLGMILEERVFVRNPRNLQLIWLPGDEGKRRDTLSPEELERIELEAFQRDLEILRQTGGGGGTDYVPPSLQGT